MSDTSPAHRAESDDRRFAEAIAVVLSWGATNSTITGMWVDRRRLTIGVGILEGDEIETTEALRRLVPAGISIRTRVASPALAELWQLQIEVFNYLEDEEIWGTWAVGLGHDDSQQSIEVGLLPGTPPSIADRVRHQFSGRPLAFVTSGRARAL